MSSKVTDRALRERLIAGIITNNHHGCRRTDDGFYATVERYVLTKRSADADVIIEDWFTFDAAQARYAELLGELVPDGTRRS